MKQQLKQDLKLYKKYKLGPVDPVLIMPKEPLHKIFKNKPEPTAQSNNI